MSKLVVGNWKMNGSFALLSDVAKTMDELRPQNVEVVVCPPSIYLNEAKCFLGQFATGGQDCSTEVAGAYTGELSASMLSDYGAKYVIVGHSERRMRHQESSELIAKKAAAAQSAGLTPILCIGETKEEKLVGATLQVLHGQLLPCLDANLDLQKIVVAYEPVWSIGTGETPGTDEISETLAWIKDWLAKQAKTTVGRVLYGGSVNGDNASSLFGLPEIDGVLVGGASLKVADLETIISAAEATA